MTRMLFLAVAIFITVSSLSAQSEVQFISHPSLSPDAKTIYFSYAGDIWQIGADGQNPVQLTSLEGSETRPKVSPDGKWLAFSSEQFGNSDLFVMPVGGGEMQQLTYHSAFDHLDSWSWDSKSLYFTSGRFNSQSGYRLAIGGGTPKRLFGHYFNTVHNLQEHPSSGEIFFNETWESKRFANRQGYKGAYNPDIKSFNPSTKEYKEYTDFEGKDFWATLDRAGKIYFVSNENNGTYNLYTFEGTTKKALTKFDTPVKEPHVSADGSAIVFEKDYQLFIYDVASGKSRKIPINVPRLNFLPKAQDFNVKGNITAFDISPDNKKLAFISRGELFVSDKGGKFIRHIPTNSQDRAMEVKWLDDNRTLLFSQTVGGYFNWFTISANGTGKEKQLTSDTQNNRNISLSNDRKQAVYLSGREEVRLMDLQNFKSKTLVKEELWGFYNDVPYFSPDDAYVLFTAIRDFESEIFVHEIATNTTTNLTQTGVAENAPFWSPDGKSLFFSSNLTEPTYPFGSRDAKIYQMMFQNSETPFRSDKFDEMFAEEEKKDEKDADSSDKKKKKADADKEEKDDDKIAVDIDFNEPMERLRRRGPWFGSQGAPFIVQKGDKLIAIYTSNHDEGKYALWKTTIEPFERDKTEKISGVDNVYGYEIAEADGSYYLLARGKIHTFDPSGGSVKAIDISHKFRKNLQNEFQQMFYELWASLEENFYLESFHGTDWEAMRKQYAKHLPFISSRAQLRRLINDMLGELNSSHLGFSSYGKEENGFFDFNTMTVGLLFSEDNPYQVAKIVKDGPANLEGKDVRPGDVLVKVNGETVDASMNREYYFTLPSVDKELALTFSRNGTEHTVKFHPEPYYLLRGHLYEEWIDENQKYVDEQSNNRIAYIHMKNMGGGELNRFMREMTSEAYKKDALILDLRYNTGGNVHDKVLQFLSRKPYLQWKYREGTPTSQPNFPSANKPIILLTNEQSLSDAEMTAAGFKALGLGKILGTETYRWIIFTSGKSLVDGSFYRLPSWGCYTLDGRNLEREGVQPDIPVDKNFKHRLEGEHPQLDRAVQEILKELGE